MHNKTNQPGWIEKHITLHSYDDVQAERENVITHFIGAILSVFALISILFILPSMSTTSLKVGMVIWGLTMILLYSASALYHHLPYGNGKRICRILDHSNIYFLIAGTYTPMMMYVGTPTAYRIIALVWGIAVFGIILMLCFWGRMKVFHVGLYLAMGWLIVFFWGDIAPFMPDGLMNWVIAAGLTYSVGVIFYVCKKIPHYHAIWHLFCLGGSTLFYIGYMLKLV